jgi:ABC-type multidrug transport system ATPase subunit
MQAAIETRRLAKSFRATLAVDGIDLRVEAGSIFGFLGPNGAGKTTTIRLLLGLLRPTSGSIRILGLPMPSARIAIARSVGALVETPCHYDNLTAAENLDVSRRLLGLPRFEVGRVLDIVDLAGCAGRQVRGFSLGMRQRLGIARALLGRPKLLILDEPTNGLDPDGIRDVRRLIKTLPERDGVTVFVSSHLLAEVEQTATHVALMWRGRLVAHGPLAETLGARAARLELGVDDSAGAAALLRSSGYSAGPGGEGRLQVGAASRPLEPGAINFLLTASGFEVFHLAERRPSLEDLYVEITSKPTTPNQRHAA